MGCNCKLTEIILGVVILVWILWTDLLGIPSKWVIIIAAALLLLHAFRCDRGCGVANMPKAKKSSRKKRR